MPRESNVVRNGTNKKSWICTFNDMMTLLMVFFVLIFSLGSLNIRDMRSARLSLRSGLGILEGGNKTSVGILPPVAHYDNETATSVRSFEKSIVDLESAKGISVTYTDRAITISLENAILFRTGSARISPDGLLVLNGIASKILNRVSNPVRIEGHTDNDPIHTKKYPSNWELSMARAVNVLKYLIKKCNVQPKRLSAVGYGATKPLFTNDTDAHKSLNRRVEIVIVSEESR